MDFRKKNPIKALVYSMVLTRHTGTSNLSPIATKTQSPILVSFVSNLLNLWWLVRLHQIGIRIDAVGPLIVSNAPIRFFSLKENYDDIYQCRKLR